MSDTGEKKISITDAETREMKIMENITVMDTNERYTSDEDQKKR